MRQRTDRLPWQSMRAPVPAGPARQRGGFVMGMVVGLLVGLAVALGVALYVAKVPVPFVDKVPLRSAEQDASEQKRNKDWEPNAPLAGKAARPGGSASGLVEPAASPASAASAAAAGASAPARDPAAILAGAALPVPPPGMASPPAATKAGGDPYVYFVQAGAFQRPEDAEAQRARLAILGLEARVVERDQSGRIIHRVRVGPYDKMTDAEGTHDRLVAAGIEARLMRAERPPQ
jgi:cell division protein FtsN